MQLYQNILLAVELNPASDKYLIAKALDMVNIFGARISIVHAIEQLAGYGATYGVAVGAEIDGILLDRAREEMKKLAKKIAVPEDVCVVKIGSAKEVVLEEAEQQNIDLIIIGSHGRRGLRWLLGSTANAVLNSAKCDVLSVRLKN